MAGWARPPRDTKRAVQRLGFGDLAALKALVHGIWGRPSGAEGAAWLGFGARLRSTVGCTLGLGMFRVQILPGHANSQESTSHATSDGVH